MKLNEHEALLTSKVLLVPYCSHHVETYHDWMEDEDLREATASDRLTLDEEYDMQQKWREDHDKLTFIICLPPSDSSSADSSSVITPGDSDTRDRMIGDINLFIYDAENDESAIDDGFASAKHLIGEIELMIAREDLHNKGYGRAALLVFMEYVLSNWHAVAAPFAKASGRRSSISTPKPILTHLRARINENNKSSVRLFNNTGFRQTREDANFFGEIEMRWDRNVEDLRRLRWYEPSHRLTYG